MADKIQDRVEEHFKAIKDSGKYNYNDYIVCAANGSMNYNLWDEQSDVDTKMLMIPNAYDLYLDKKHINKVEIMDNGEHCTVKDFRDYFKIFRKANINFLEILCTEYYAVNPRYEIYWNYLRKHCDDIANLNPSKLVYSSLGMAMEKAKKICHDSPANHELIEKYGYVAKELQHIMRLYLFVKRYLVDGAPFSQAIWVDGYDTFGKESMYREMMMDIKRYRTVFTPENAKLKAENYVVKMDELIENNSKFIPEPSKDAADVLESTQFAIMNFYMSTVYNKL